MEPEEIAVVLARASELHDKLDNAIVLNNNNGDAQNNNNNIELRNLASVLDALKVLQHQLHSLQVLQQQQRLERDAGLAKIEESRRIFVRRLRNYNGKEQLIVQEALMFAGDNVTEKDDSSILIGDEVNETAEHPPSLDSIDPAQDIGQAQNRNQQNGSEALYFAVDGLHDDDESEINLAFQCRSEKDPSSIVEVAFTAANAVTSAVKDTVKYNGVFGFTLNVIKNSASMLGFVFGKVMGHFTEPTSKAVLIVISTLAVLSLSDFNKRRRNTVPRHPHHRISGYAGQRNSHQRRHGVGITASRYSWGNYPAHLNDGVEIGSGWNDNFVTHDFESMWEDDFPTCIVRQRTELPFYRDLEFPDVLNGQG